MDTQDLADRLGATVVGVAADGLFGPVPPRWWWVEVRVRGDDPSGSDDRTGYADVTGAVNFDGRGQYRRRYASRTEAEAVAERLRPGWDAVAVMEVSPDGICSRPAWI